MLYAKKGSPVKRILLWHGRLRKYIFLYGEDAERFMREKQSVDSPL